MKVFSVVALIALQFSSLVSAKLDFSGFEPLSNLPQEDFTVLQLGLDCPIDINIQEVTVNLIHWTVQPINETDSVVISTSPPDLVDAIVQNGILRFMYNDVSMKAHDDGAGVLIQVPRNQLEHVTTVANTMFVGQVLSGFTNLFRILVQSRQGQLVVSHRDALVDQIELIVKGKSNNVHLEFSKRNDLNLTLEGNNSFVVIDGSVTTGVVSGNQNILRIQEDISELLVSGQQNRIVTSGSSGGDGNSDQCDNVVYGAIQRNANENTCTSTAVEISAPYVTETSFSNMALTCPETTFPITSSAITNKRAILWHFFAVTTILLWMFLGL